MNPNFEGQPAAREIDRLDTENTMRALREQMWGSQDKPGLIWAIGDLTKNVSQLTETVSKLSMDIHSDDGVRATVRELKRQAEEVRLKIKSFETAKDRILIGLSLIGLGVVAVLARVGYNIANGK